MSGILSANPAVRKREEALRIQARLKQLEAGIDVALEMAKEVGASPLPTFDDYDVQCLAEALAEDHSWLPHGSHVETRAEDNSTPLSRAYGPTYVDRATSISLPIIGTYTPRQLLEQGLVTKGGKFSPSTYERLLSEVDGVVKGKLIGPRDVLIARQEAARAKYPQLWHS